MDRLTQCCWKWQSWGRKPGFELQSLCCLSYLRSFSQEWLPKHRASWPKQKPQGVSCKLQFLFRFLVKYFPIPFSSPDYTIPLEN